MPILTSIPSSPPSHSHLHPILTPIPSLPLPEGSRFCASQLPGACMGYLQVNYRTQLFYRRRDCFAAPQCLTSNRKMASCCLLSCGSPGVRTTKVLTADLCAVQQGRKYLLLEALLLLLHFLHLCLQLLDLSDICCRLGNREPAMEADPGTRVAPKCSQAGALHTAQQASFCCLNATSLILKANTFRPHGQAHFPKVLPNANSQLCTITTKEQTGSSHAAQPSADGCSTGSSGFPLLGELVLLWVLHRKPQHSLSVL